MEGDTLFLNVLWGLTSNLHDLQLILAHRWPL